MRHSNITATCLIDNRLVLNIDISLLTMAKIISKERSFKSSASKPLEKPPPMDKTFFLEPSIHFYAIEYSDDTEEG